MIPDADDYGAPGDRDLHGSQVVAECAAPGAKVADWQAELVNAGERLRLAAFWKAAQPRPEIEQALRAIGSGSTAMGRTSRQSFSSRLSPARPARGV